MTEPGRSLGATSDDFGVTLAILRIIRRWSQSELAEAAGVTNSAISDYERGKVDPQTQTLQKLVRALGLPLSALDQTHSFILLVRAQMVGDEPPSAVGDPAFSAAASVSPAEHSRRMETARIASDGGRFFTSFIYQLLEGNRSSE
jgi:transcriptional regulator with XRE-family HTH domain